jgi:hypothetical protein
MRIFGEDGGIPPEYGAFYVMSKDMDGNRLFHKIEVLDQPEKVIKEYSDTKTLKKAFFMAIKDL